MIGNPWPFDPLPMFGFDVIMADPPWLFKLRSPAGEAKSPQGRYRCMSTGEIAAMPVNRLARRDCWLWLWATFPMIDDGLSVLRAWGFTFVTAGTWVKRGHSGKLAMGTGFVLRGNAEPFLLGRVGEPKTFSRSIRNVIEAPLRQHSEKPDEAYAAAETLFGPAFRADLFSRKTRPGWTAWGDQTGALDGAPSRAGKRIVEPAAPMLPRPKDDPDQARLFEVAA